jgi:hypothetical protein
MVRPNHSLWLWSTTARQRDVAELRRKNTSGVIRPQARDVSALHASEAYRDGPCIGFSWIPTTCLASCCAQTVTDRAARRQSRSREMAWVLLPSLDPLMMRA